jgi:hypothetical protein
MLIKTSCKSVQCTYLVGDGGGYEIPRWLGDNKLDCPEWLWLCVLDVPGTSNVLLLFGIFKLGILCPKLLNCCTVSEFDVDGFNFFELVGVSFDLSVTPKAIPSSLDIELAFSKSTDTAFDSFSSTDPL